MHKLTIKVVNRTAPLDYIAFIGEKTKEIKIEHLEDFNKIIDEVTTFLSTIEGAKKTIVSVRVSKGNGSMVLDGIFENGAFVTGTIAS